MQWLWRRSAREDETGGPSAGRGRNVAVLSDERGSVIGRVRRDGLRRIASPSPSHSHSTRQRRRTRSRIPPRGVRHRLRLLCLWSSIRRPPIDRRLALEALLMAQRRMPVRRRQWRWDRRGCIVCRLLVALPVQLRLELGRQRWWLRELARWPLRLLLLLPVLRTAIGIVPAPSGLGHGDTIE